jgi:hypothetical protein
VRIGHRTLIALGVMSVGAGAVGTFQAPLTARASGSPITFGVPAPVDPIHGVGEPDIGVDRAGNVFVSGPGGTGEQRSLWWSSVDGGNTYRVIEPIQDTTASALIGEPNAPGGGDTDIAFDNQPTQTQYFADLAALVALRNATTSDEGKTVTSSIFPGASQSISEVDRQWYVVYDPITGGGVSTGSACGVSSSPACATHPIIYVEYGPSPSKWYRSTDGHNFTKASQTTHFGADGYPSIDQTTGDVFQANYSGSTIKLNIGTPFDASGDLCFRDDTTATCPAADGAGTGLITVASPVANSSGEAANFVVSSMDSARNLYVEWVGRSNTPSQRQVFVSAASAASGWTNWTAPVQVSDGSTATGDAVNVFPWIKAGGAGRADGVWYGDQSTLDPSATCTPLSSGCHVWNVFMNELVFPVDSNGGVTGVAPSTTLVKVTPHPMDYFDVCLSGTGCVLNSPPGNRNLADFFEVNFDHSGAAEIVYDDMSNNLIQAGTSNPADHAGWPLPTVIRQNGGPGLLGGDVTGASTAPMSGLNDPSGDALYPVIQGTNLPAMDLTDSSLSLSGGTLTVTMKVADLTQLASVPIASTGTTAEAFLTRWQMGNTIYYAEATLPNTTTGAQFSAGKASTVDLCSVSACRPLIGVYGETTDAATGQSSETGTVSCPSSPSASNPCTITVTVNGADVGGPTASSLLEEVGAYSYVESHPQTGTTNAQAQEDNVPLEIDGVCCYNFQANNLQAPIPETPWAPALIAVGGLLVTAGVFTRRRRSRSISSVG